LHQGKCLGLVLAALLIAVSSGSVAASPPTARVLVSFKHQPGAAEQALVRGVGGSIKYTYHLVPAIAATIPEAAISALRANPNVAGVDLDRQVSVLDREDLASWGVGVINADIVQARGNSGAGVKLAIIDSGIDYTHPDLSANYRGGYDFVNNDSDPMDDLGHGTGVAGVVAAAANGAGIVGVAPEVSLYALKVLDSSGIGLYSNIIAALQWSVDNGIQVTNNSYGEAENPGAIAQAAFDNAASAGLVNVAAAGNSGSPTGAGDNVFYPARYDSVIAVAATMPGNVRAFFSSTGPAVELAAPGFQVTTTLPGGGYGPQSGTSIASPYAAGAAALVISSGLDGASVRQRLDSTAKDLGAPGRDPLYGFGLVNAAAAVGIPAR